MAAALSHSLARVFSDNRRLRIGLFGGSFNPAHEGHSSMADRAVQGLKLDAVWWLVSPQNPLKSSDAMSPFAARFASAMEAAAHCHHSQRMLVSPLEKHLGLNRTSSLVKQIKQQMPRAHLVWLMGADSFADLPHWHRPWVIPSTVGIAVIDRPGFSAAALGGRGAARAGRRLPAAVFSARYYRHGSWCFLRGNTSAQSSTAIRAQY